MIWFAIPTANIPRAEKCLKAWKDRGYMTAVLIDGANSSPPKHCDLWIWQEQYRGWGKSVNQLCKLLTASHGAEWVVSGGDDHYPDPKLSPEEIAAQTEKRFGGTLGVMQPIGDLYGSIERCADSPWFGAKWIRRAYQGNGPMCEAYEHFFMTEELQSVATRMGCFQQRADITQYHDHFLRNGEPATAYQEAARNGPWQRDCSTFQARSMAGFPGSNLSEG